jgi:hypothetical protein
VYYKTSFFVTHASDKEAIASAHANIGNFFKNLQIQESSLSVPRVSDKEVFNNIVTIGKC